MSDKIIDLTKYTDNREDALELPDELIDAYIKESELATPELWDRIEAGFEQEVTEIDAELKKADKQRHKKVMGWVAAAAVITIIAIPTIVISNIANHSDEKNDSAGVTVQEKFEDADSDGYMDNYAEEAAEEDYYFEMDDADDAADMAEADSYTQNAGVNNIAIKDEAVESEAAAYDDEEYDNADDADYDSNAESDSDNSEYISDNAGTSETEAGYADEISVEDIVYTMSQDEPVTELSKGYDLVVELENDFCTYPSDKLNVYMRRSGDSIVYVEYGDVYKMYIRERQ